MNDRNLNERQKLIKLFRALAPKNVLTARMQIEHDPDDPEYLTIYNVGHTDEKLCVVIEFATRDGKDAEPRAEEFYLSAPKAYELANMLMNAAQVVEDHCIKNDRCQECSHLFDACICEKEDEE